MNRKDYERNYAQFLINSAKIVANHLSDTMPNDYINQLNDSNQVSVDSQEVVEVKQIKGYDKNKILLWLSIGFLIILLLNGGNKNV